MNKHSIHHLLLQETSDNTWEFCMSSPWVKPPHKIKIPNPLLIHFRENCWSGSTMAANIALLGVTDKADHTPLDVTDKAAPPLLDVTDNAAPHHSRWMSLDKADTVGCHWQSSSTTGCHWRSSSTTGCYWQSSSIDNTWHLEGFLKLSFMLRALHLLFLCFRCQIWGINGHLPLGIWSIQLAFNSTLFVSQRAPGQEPVSSH